MLGLGLPQGWEWLAIVVVGLLLFGKRLPEVGRSLGRGIVEFKKGVKGIQDEIESESSEAPVSKKQLESDARSVSRAADFSAQAEKQTVRLDGEGA